MSGEALAAGVVLRQMKNPVDGATGVPYTRRSVDGTSALAPTIQHLTNQAGNHQSSSPIRQKRLAICWKLPFVNIELPS